jgi:hypothetical protein
MCIRSIVQVGAPAACLAGVVCGLCGTYLMTQSYHPFKPSGFIGHIGRYLWIRLSNGKLKAREYLEETIKTTASPEDRSTSLRGIYYLFASFLLQSLGSIFWLVDGIWGQFPKTP